MLAYIFSSVSELRDNGQNGTKRYSIFELLDNGRNGTKR